MLSVSAVNAYDNATNGIGVCDDQTTLVISENNGIRSFADLNGEISKIAAGGNFTLKTDYAFNSNDSNYRDGIRITEDNIIIDGDGHTINGAGLARIFNIASNNVTLKNIIFVNGYSSENGGAIFTINNLNILNSTFINNSAYNGGAICFKDATANITINGYFEGNTAERGGGAIYVQGESRNSIFASEFYNNTAKAASGGAIFFYKLVEGNIFESTFRHNYALYGAGIFFYNKANNNRFRSDFRFNIAKSCGGAMFFYNTSNNNNFSGYFINNSALGKVDPENGNGGAITFKNTSTNSIFNCDFVNNTAALNGGGVNYRQTPYNITFNSNFINNKAENGGGVNFFETFENVVFNGQFRCNNASYGGAIATTNGVIENTSFIENRAETGGAIYFDDNGAVINCEFDSNEISDNYGDGGAVYFNNEGSIANCNFTSNKAVYYAGAVYFFNDGKIEDSNFKDNEAQNGGSVYFHGTGTVNNCNFTSNSARTGGAIEFWRSGTVKNSNFNDNFARFSGGAIYCDMDVKIYDCVFNSNSAMEYAGGAVCSYYEAEIIRCDFVNNTGNQGGAINLGGDGAKISESNFFDNSAINKGGAIYLGGSNANLNSVNFSGNNATQGSAIYKSKNAMDFTIANVIFGRNRADSNKIIIEVEGNESYAPNNNVTVHVYLWGNDNIANAIWNDGGIDSIKLANVSCEFSQDGRERELVRFNDNALKSPTDGFIDSSSIWQSPHNEPVEDAQLLDISITDEDGNVVYNLTNDAIHSQNNAKRSRLLLLSDDSRIKETDVDGKITVELKNLKAGTYKINAEHADDAYYTGLAEDSEFVIYDVVLNVVVTADVDVISNNTLVNFTITVRNDGSGNATDVILTDSLPVELIYSNWGIIKGNGATITAKTLGNGVELNISNITAGNSVSIWIEALSNGVGKLTNNVTVYCKENDTKVNAYATVEVVIPEGKSSANPENDFQINPIGTGNNKSTGNPIFALFIALSLLAIINIRKK